MINNLPDLAVRKFEPDRSFILPGQDVYFETEIVNQGNHPVDSVELSFGYGRRHYDRYKLDGLAPGESHQVAFGPLTGSHGTYVYKVLVDPDNTTTESNEKNNTAKASFSVIDTRPPGPPMPPPRPPRRS